MKGIKALSIFFAFGALMNSLAATTLLFRDNTLNKIWQINPQGHAALLKMETSGFILLTAIAVVCAAAAIGLWFRRLWGYRLSCALLLIQLIGDFAMIVFRQDYRAIIGIPIVALILHWLTKPSTRNFFHK